MRVLLSAYACEPWKGSEPEVGLRTLLASASKHETCVLTRENNIGPLRRFLADHPLAKRIQLEGLDLSPAATRIKRYGGAGLHVYYHEWQKAAEQRLLDLDARNDFDVVHHVTFATHWTRTGAAGVEKPFVWGPVGGGVATPAGLRSELGIAGAIEDTLRHLARTMGSRLPYHERAVRRATVVLVQNRETANKLGRRDAVLAPNGLAVHPLDPPARLQERRREEVAVVGRLVPLKGVKLAVRAFRYVSSPTAVLRIYGKGPDRKRVARAIARWDLSARVRFMDEMPRDQLLADLHSAGVLLHPSFHEEGGMAVGESLALGTPVVCLDQGGPAGQVECWDHVPATRVRVSTPKETAQRLAAGVDHHLRNLAPLQEVPSAPSLSFRDVILAAYESAAAARPRASGSAGRDCLGA